MASLSKKKKVKQKKKTTYRIQYDLRLYFPFRSSTSIYHDLIKQGNPEQRQ